MWKRPANLPSDHRPISQSPDHITTQYCRHLTQTHITTPAHLAVALQRVLAAEGDRVVRVRLRGECGLAGGRGGRALRCLDAGGRKHDGHALLGDGDLRQWVVMVMVVVRCLLELKGSWGSG